MSADLATVFDEFDRGRLSRRQLLKALGIAVAIRPAEKSRSLGGRVNRRPTGHLGG